MRLFARLLVAVALIVVWVPAANADLSDEIVYLLPDTSDRYLPAIDSGSGPVALANINTITPPAISADGTKVAFAGAVGDESLGRYAIFLVNSNGSGLTKLTDGALAEFDPTWAPDGQTVIASQNQEGGLGAGSCCRLVEIDVTSGQISSLTDSVGAIRPAYAPQGDFIVYDTPAGVWRIPDGGGTPTQITASGGFDATVSPNGTRVAYLVNTGSSIQIRTVSASGGSPTTVYSTSGQLESPIWNGGRIYFIEYTGLGYDGRRSVSLRSVRDSGGGVTTERSLGTHTVGVHASLYEAPAHHAGDIDGDGEDDISETGPVNRTALLSSGSDFDPEIWGSLQPQTGWKLHLPGDFDGNGRSDVASYRTSNGTWHIAAAGSGSYSTSVWADYSTASGWSAQLAGDFTGDGRDDIGNFHPSNGTWWISRSTGSSFSTSLWADFSTPSGWGPQLVGDFNGDGRDDIANFHDSNGTWWVSRSTGSGFVTSLWADFATASGWSAHVAGDFTGDERDDIANFHPSNGTWWVSRSTGSSFSTSLWADFSTPSGWKHHVGDLTGDGRDDIANYHESSGSWWVSESNGSRFATSRWLP